eukprot:2360297-Rhodomonas_salina.4
MGCERWRCREGSEGARDRYRLGPACAMLGTDLAYAATSIGLGCYAMPGTDLACATTIWYLPRRVLCDARSGTGELRFGLRACYAMSGTDLVYTVIGLRARYAMSGTDLAYAATRLGPLACISRTWYRISGRAFSLLSYAFPMRYPVLRLGILVPGGVS